MNNRFFRLALSSASKLAGKPARMLVLTGQLANRFYSMDKNKISAAALKTHTGTFARLITAVAKGEYRNVSLSTLIKIVAAVIYFLNPIDLIPDAVIGFGLTDDLAVLTWVFNSTKEELEKFKEWEQLKSRIIHL